MQALCQLDVQGDEYLERIVGFLADSRRSGPAQEYADRIVRSCWPQRSALDSRLDGLMDHWAIERISAIERNVLRVALVELDAGMVPAKVVINDAIEIGREYGGADSPAFINGVLDSAWKRMPSGGASRGDG